MSDNLTTITARYQEVIPMAQLAIDPTIAGSRHEFMFEGRNVTLALPPMPPNRAPDVPTGTNSFESSATVFSWDANNEPRGIEVGAIKLSIENLQLDIPSAAAAYTGMNGRLYDERQRADLDDFSDHLYFLAEHAVNYWLRILWWKTGHHMIARRSDIAAPRAHGGALINVATDTRFYVPMVCRTVVARMSPIMQRAVWSEIDAALKAGQEPPVWHEYLTSAHQRMDSGDKLAAILDLAVAAEARIRNFLNSHLPAAILRRYKKRTVRDLKMWEIFKYWRIFGLPLAADLPSIKELFDIRNAIMHSGADTRADASFFKVAASAVRALLVAI